MNKFVSLETSAKDLSRVYFFDLDGTLTKEELLPKIAREFSVETEIQQLTLDTIAGKVTFAESFSTRVELLSHIPVDQVSSCLADCQIDSHILNWIHSQPDPVFVLTGNLDLWVEGLLAKYGLVGISSEGAWVDGAVKINKIMDKSIEISKFNQYFTVMVGDGANDLGAMDLANISIAYGGVHAPAAPLFEVADLIVSNEVTLCKVLNQL